MRRDGLDFLDEKKTNWIWNVTSMKVCRRFLVHLEKTKLHHIVCALQRPANRNFVQSLRPNQTFKNVSLGIYYKLKLKSTSKYPQKMRPGKLCTDFDWGFVNKLHCCFLGHMILQVKNIRMFIPIFHYKCCFRIIHFILWYSLFGHSLSERLYRVRTTVTCLRPFWNMWICVKYGQQLRNWYLSR